MCIQIIYCKCVYINIIYMIIFIYIYIYTRVEDVFTSVQA